MKSADILDEYPITYRQLYYWTTVGFLGDDAKLTGNGVKREYTADEVQVLSRMLLLVNAGVRPPVASRLAKGDVVAVKLLESALEACRA